MLKSAKNQKTLGSNPIAAEYQDSRRDPQPSDHVPVTELAIDDAHSFVEACGKS
jgi:hypothetical protein